MHTASVVTGIVVGRVNYGESDLIVHLLTETGRFSAFAPAARKSRRRFGGALEPFTTVRAELGRRRQTSGMSSLVRVELVSSRRQLSRSLEVLTLASYACELCGRLAPEEAPTELGAYLEAFLDELRQVKPTTVLRRAFELKLLTALGYRPHLDSCPVCYQPGRFLDFVRGGLFCEDHRPSDGREIGPYTIMWLKHVLDERLGDACGPLAPDEANRAARAVAPSLDLVWRHFIERPIRSQKLLSELGM